jgi:allantoinase
MSADAPTVVRSRRVVTPEGVRPAAVHIRAGMIMRVGAWDDVGDGDGDALHDVGELMVLPGLVDTHVHINEPGRTEWEGFSTATRAAAAGGVTTLLDMPLNAIPATTSVAALREKMTVADGKCTVDVGFIGGVVPGNTHELTPLRTAGAFAFKCFLSPSGVDEFPRVDEADLRAAFPVLAKLGTPLMVHAELPPYLKEGTPGNTGYPAYLASRPPEAEKAAIDLLVRLMDWCPVPVHVVHVSSAQGVQTIRAARARGLPLTAETCPHYLAFSAVDVPTRATEFKCAPPIREPVHRDALWQGLLDGDLDMIASDHSPAPSTMKATGGDFFAAWGGIASLQLGLAVVWTAAARRGIAVEQVVRWMGNAPAALVGLDKRKGRIVEGCDADLVVWDPEAEVVVDPKKLYHRHPLTPYAGNRLHGVVSETFLRGRVVYRGGAFRAPRGVMLAASPVSRTHA